MAHKSTFNKCHNRLPSQPSGNTVKKFNYLILQSKCFREVDTEINNLLNKG